MKSFRLLSLAIGLSCFSVGFSQSLQEAADAYNAASGFISSGDYTNAIATLEKCVTISQQVGEEADEYRLNSAKALPALYLNRADQVLESKDYPSALKAFDAAIASAEKYDDPATKEKATKPIPSIYYAMGVASYQSNAIDDAIKHLDQATLLDPDMARAYYVKGATYAKQKGSEAKMVENYKLAIEKGEATGDQGTVKNSANALSKYYYNDGINSMKIEKYDDAIASFNQVVAVDGTYADAYYRLSSCYNKKKNWDNAISNAEKALEYKQGDAKSKDGIYYELGTAYAGKNDTGKACESFKKVTSEPYLKGAKYQIEVALKCK